MAFAWMLAKAASSGPRWSVNDIDSSHESVADRIRYHCKIQSRADRTLACPAPGLRFNLPDAIPLRERVGKGTCPNDGLTLDRHTQAARDDRVGRCTLDVPETQFVIEALVAHTEIRSPFRDIGE